MAKVLVTSSLNGKRILLVIGGGIAAYKCLDLIRRLQDDGARVQVVMTRSARRFVTKLSVAALAGTKVFSDLFNPDDEHEIGHIGLSRSCDIVLVAPATADLLARMAGGHADDLASAILMATDKPVLAAPAMNPKMWLHPATKRNVACLKGDGITFIGPALGEMAEPGEAGPGRMVEVPELIAATIAVLGKETAAPARQILAGRHVVVTAGPTHEPIDPVRYIANRSSGRQGYAIAAAAARMGAAVTLLSGPVALADPPGVRVDRVETAQQMMSAVLDALPADIAIFAAAVADWRVAATAAEKIKKAKGAKTGPPKFDLIETPDILQTVSKPGSQRPALVIGFAAETESVIANARAKLSTKGCDLIVANDVSPAGGAMGGTRNTVHIVSADKVDSWPEMAKSDVAERLLTLAAEALPAARTVGRKAAQ